MKKADKLRDNAEMELQKAKKKETVLESNSKLVHELQVHQVELEMQNEELKETQGELAKLYDEYHEMYNDAPVGYFSLDRYGNVRNVNIKGAKLLGLEKDMIIGFAFIRFIPLNYQTKYYRCLKDAMFKRKVEEVELQLIREKSLFYVQMQIMPIYDNFDEKYRITITDITERKKTDEKLIQNHNLLETVVKSAEGPIFSVDCNYRYTSFNLQHAMIMKNLFDADIEIGDNILDYHTNPENRQNAKLNIDKALDGEVVKIESYAGDAPQNYHYFSIFHTPVKDSDGKITGAVVYAHDLTERKQAEKALKEARDNLEEKVEERTVEVKRLADIVESSDDAIIGKDLNSIIFSWNRGAEKIYGYSADEMIGKHISILMEPEEWEKISKLIEKVKKGKIGARYEGRRLKKDGYMVDVSVILSPIKSKEGKITGISIISRDITESKQAEEELELASIYNRSLIEASVDPLVTIGPDGRITDVNTATEQVTGYSRNELIGTDFSNYFTDPHKAKYGYQQVFREGRVWDYSLEIIHKNGHLTPVLYNASVYRDDSGEVIGVFAAARDITERKKAEEALKLASMYNRSLIEASLDPLVTIGPDGEITDVNESTEAVTGYSRDEIIGTDFCSYFTEPEKARKGYQQVFKEDFVRDYPLEIKHKNGNITPVLYNASVYKDESREVIGVFAAARDITERKEAEEQLKESIQELERSNVELRSFAYITSHDLQEPLRTMGSYAGLLKMRYEGQLDEDADDFLEYMVSGAIRLQDMIKGLLNYSHVGKPGEEFQEFNAEDALNTVLSNLESSIDECHAEVTHDQLPNIVADESRILRVFHNLIGNALKFRREGVPPKIHVSAQNKDDEYIFSVSDNGIGIEEQYTDRIFEVFKRLHPIGEYKGAGIGLAIVKRIVERHGGRLWVESEFGVGSTFYFTIPELV